MNEKLILFYENISFKNLIKEVIESYSYFLWFFLVRLVLFFFLFSTVCFCNNFKVNYLQEIF